MSAKMYDNEFYDNQIEGSYASALVVLEILYSFYKPKTVVDIGCGRGAWLAAAEKYGAKELQGYDGIWVNNDTLLSKNINFIPIDFEKTIPKNHKKYDLCVCLELLEHLPENASRKIIKYLCETSDIILFSAAIKGQGGTNHINEQNQSFWIRQFESNMFDCLDIFRSELWNDARVKPWYRQNIFLFVAHNCNKINTNILKLSEKPIYDIAHPVILENKTNSYLNTIGSLEERINKPKLRFILSLIKRYIKHKLF